MQISKSEYMMSLKHPAWVWLKKHQPQKLPKPGPALQARFDEGNAFERYALQLFPGVVELGFDDFDGYRSLTQRTRNALDYGASAIAQGRFEAGPITCIVDLLVRLEDGRFDLMEIKSNTKEKEEHVFDLAFQRAVLEAAGLSIRDTHVLHVNKDYRRNGEIDPHKLVKRVCLTDVVSDKMDFTQRAIKRALDIVSAGTMPDPSPRYARMKSYSDWLDIYQSLNGPLPATSIFLLPYLKAEALDALLDDGVTTIDELHDLSVLTPAQARYVKGFRSGTRHIDMDGVRAFLNDLTYPLYFLDYETSSSIVPPFDGLQPYQQLPFQYSLHIQEEPGGDIQHREYLHQSASHPVPDLLERLTHDLGKEGSVLVWFAPFERSRNSEMGTLFPGYAAFLEQINARVIDLMDPFKDGRVSDPGFGGSASIKKVLPVLVPDLSYGDLGIQEGETASRLWKEVTLDGRQAAQRQEIYENLKEYCRRDTWAMVRIFQVLSGL